jgi:catechol 2,3-dioxygenase-like lactoylglutathione lyase family enzyme
MNSHVSTILLGVKDMERSKRFYTEGLGWKVQNDYKISQEGRREDPQARGEVAVGRVRRILRRPGWLHLEHRLQRRRKGPALRRVAGTDDAHTRRPTSTASGRDGCDLEFLRRAGGRAPPDASGPTEIGRQVTRPGQLPAVPCT